MAVDAAFVRATYLTWPSCICLREEVCARRRTKRDVGFGIALKKSARIPVATATAPHGQDPSPSVTRVEKSELNGTRSSVLDSLSLSSVSSPSRKSETISQGGRSRDEFAAMGYGIYPGAPPPNTMPPGPMPLPVVGNALDIIKLGLAELMLSYAKKFGSIVKFAILKNVCYLVSDPDAIAWINTVNSRNYLDRWTPPGFEALLYEGTLRGLVFSQGRPWMQHRQIAGKAFRSQDFLDNFVRAVCDKAQYLMENRWEIPGNVDRVINVHQEMRLFTLDVIGDAAFGTNFGAMRDGGHEIESRLANVLGGVMNIIKTPLPLWKFLKTPARASIENDLNRLHEIELGLVNERRKRFNAEQSGFSEESLQDSSPSKSDLLGMLLKARDSQQNRALHFTDEDLMWDVHDIIFAGHETTASALGAAIFQIAGSPRVLHEIHKEIDRVLPDGRQLQYDDIEKLEYIGMVLSETLRMVPPTALIGRIAKERDVIAGYEVPAGTNVLMSPYVMGRLERLWDNPEEFRPERFSTEAVAARNPMIHTPFGAGPRVCLGARLATMEAKAALAIIFQKYTFERTQDTLQCDYNSTVSFKSGMDMILRRRQAL